MSNTEQCRLIHNRYEDENGFVVDIKTKPVSEMTLAEKIGHELTLKFILDRVTVRYECQLLHDKLEQMSKRGANE